MKKEKVKPVLIQTLLSPELAAWVVEQAEKEGLSVAAWVRRQLIALRDVSSAIEIDVKRVAVPVEPIDLDSIANPCSVGRGLSGKCIQCGVRKPFDGGLFVDRRYWACSVKCAIAKLRSSSTWLDETDEITREYIRLPTGERLP